MKVLVIGLGSIGMRHARLLQGLGDVEVVAFRSHGQAGNSLGIKEFRSWGDVQAFDPEVAIIATPTHCHMADALRCLESGMHIFLEKPLAHSMAGVEALQEIAQAHGRTVYIGYTLRFHPVIRKLKELLDGQRVLHGQAVCASYLPQWRPGRDCREVYSAKRSQGGGVVLDLSHEPDYLSFLLGPVTDIQGQVGRRGDVTVDSEDYADLLMTCGEDGVPVNVHLDYLARRAERWVRIVTCTESLFGDLLSGQVVVEGDRGDQRFSLAVDRDRIFCDQFEYFRQNIGDPAMMNGIAEASVLFKKLLEFRDG